MIKVFKLFGIDVLLHWSLVVLFVLVCPTIYSVAMKHNAGSVESAVIAMVVSVLFVVSVLAHEFAHALAGRRLGIKFSRITLFALGGMAQMDSGLMSPRVEFLMAGAGPLCSVGIGGVMWVIGSVFNLGNGLGLVCGFLFSINLLLGLFNGLAFFLFPSDAARMLRAGIWGATGNFTLATRLAARLGQGGAIGFCVLGLVMALGVKVPLFGTGVVNGIWTAVIGFFLLNLATAELKSVKDE